MVNRKTIIFIAGFWTVSFLTGYGSAATGLIDYEEYQFLKKVIAGIIRKVKEIDLRLKDVEERVSRLERLIQAEEKKCTVNASWLRVRKCPSFECKVVGLLKKGTQRKVLEEKEGWKKIEEGWVKAEYCK